MIAVDTQLLVYAHRRDSEWHRSAAAAVTGLAEGRGSWAIPWPCIHEFYAVVTHPRIYRPASRPEQALRQLEAWFGSASLTLLSESRGYWSRLLELVQSSKTRGPQVHDVRIAALCLHAGVRELWTMDRDFSRFPAIKTRNPLA